MREQASAHMRSSAPAQADSARDQHVLEVLARTPAGPAIYVTTQTFFEPKACAFQDLRVELAAVVDDDHDRAASSQDGRRIEQHLYDPLGVGGQGGAGISGGSCTDLELAAIVETEQLVRVAMLLVVVDQARVRRRGEHTVVTAGQF